MANIPVSVAIDNLLKSTPSTTVTTAAALTALGAVTTSGALGTPTSGTLTNATDLPIVAGTSGTLTIARGGTGATTATNARTALELGTAATAATGDFASALIAPTETFSSTVQALVAAHRSSNTTASAAALCGWARCLGELESGGILDELIDGACFRQGYNASTAPKSIRNVSGTVRGTVPIGIFGAIFTANSANTYEFEVADARVSTLAQDFRYDENSADYATPCSLSASGGSAISARSITPEGSPGKVFTSDGGSNVYTDVIGDQNDAFCVHRFNSLETIAAMSSDNAASPAVKVWINGLLTLTDSAGNTKQNTALTRVNIGAAKSAASTFWIPHSGTVASFLLFNKVLSDAENVTVAKAMRHLDLRTSNLVVMGDSRTAQLSTDASYRVGSWPYKYWRSPAMVKNFRLCSVARNGWRASNMDTAFAARVDHHAANGTSVLDSRLIIWTGANDWLADQTAATIWGLVQSMAVKARALGMTVTVCTDPEADGGYSAPREAERVSFNTTVRANAHLYDSIWDIDLFLKAPRTSAAWLNSYHLNHLGNGWLAQNLLMGGLQGLTVP